MAKAFFSYAHEDQETVEIIHAALAAEYPDHAVWVNKYEIVAGESLLEKIAEGIDEAEKFFVFLSKVSITKPWVKREYALSHHGRDRRHSSRLHRAGFVGEHRSGSEVPGGQALH